MNNRKDRFIVIPAATLIISVFMWLFLWGTLFLGRNFFPVLERSVINPVIDQIFRSLFYLAWFVLGPLFTLLNSWRIEVSKEMIFFQKFFGIIKKKYEKKDIRLVNFEKASKKRIAPKIRLEFIDGQKIRIEHGTVGFTKMWEYLGGEKNDIFLKQKKK